MMSPSKFPNERPGALEPFESRQVNVFASRYPRFRFGYQHLVKLNCVLFEVLVGIIEAIVEIVHSDQTDQAHFFLVGEDPLGFSVMFM
jgi:hypothetical protein